MVSFSQYPLQKSIFQALNGDSALRALVSGIYDRPVQGTAFPYITFGDWVGNDWSSMTDKGMELLPVLEVWSREGGHKQAAKIMERVHTLLHDASLSVEGQTLVLLRFSGSTIGLESDGCTYRGVVRLRALLQAAA